MAAFPATATPPTDLPPDPEASYATGRGAVTPWEAEGVAEAAASLSDAPAPHGEAGTRYRLQGILGRGGFGEVFEATQESLERTVAVKALRRDVLESLRDDRVALWEMENGFRLEALTLAALEHPAIVPVHDLLWDSEGHTLIAMKRVRGEPWNAAMKRERQEMAREAFLARHLTILTQVTQAVAFAHSRGILHRDIKPSQVLLGEFGEVMLMDWGLALVFDRALLSAQVPTLGVELLPDRDESQNPVGTPAFMAPEQTDDTPARLGPWTDVYLLGATLYYLLTGKPPHSGDNSQEAYLKAMLGEIPPLAPEDAPADLAALCLEALNPDPALRPPSARAFLERLQRFTTGADRIAESIAIATKLECPNFPNCTAYEDHARVLHRLDQALLLWPGNEHARQLEAKARVHLAQRAMDRRDWGLAQFEAQSLGDARAAERDALLAEVATRRAAAERKDRLVLWAVGVGGVLAGLAAGAFFL